MRRRLGATPPMVIAVIAMITVLGVRMADDDRQDVMDQPYPALDPAHRSGESDRIGA